MAWKNQNQQKSDINRKPRCFCSVVFSRFICPFVVSSVTHYLLFAIVFFICLRLCSMFNVHWLCFSIRKSLFVVDALSLFARSVHKKATTNKDLFAQPSPQPPPPPSRPPTPLTDTRPIYAAMMSMWTHHLHTACIKVLFVFLFAMAIYYQMPTMKI